MTDIMEARRKGFEEWILSSFMSDGDRDLVLRDELGEYYSVGVAERWEMYNAALDSVCVELPEEKVVRGYSEKIADAMGFNDALEYCREAIERAGLKVKP